MNLLSSPKGWSSQAFCVAGIFRVQNPSQTTKILFLSPTREPIFWTLQRAPIPSHMTSFSLTFSLKRFMHVLLHTQDWRNYQQKVFTNLDGASIYHLSSDSQVCANISYGVMCNWAACLLASRSSPLTVKATESLKDLNLKPFFWNFYCYDYELLVYVDACGHTHVMPQVSWSERRVFCIVL